MYDRRVLWRDRLAVDEVERRSVSGGVFALRLACDTRERSHYAPPEVVERFALRVASSWTCT